MVRRLNIIFKTHSDLNTHDAPYFEAIVNSPGLFDPWKKPQNAPETSQSCFGKNEDQWFLTDAELTDSKLKHFLRPDLWLYPRQHLLYSSGSKQNARKGFSS